VIAPRQSVVLFGHSAASPADRPRAPLDRPVDVLALPEDAAQVRIDAALQDCTALVGRSSRDGPTDPDRIACRSGPAPARGDADPTGRGMATRGRCRGASVQDGSG